MGKKNLLWYFFKRGKVGSIVSTKVATRLKKFYRGDQRNRGKKV